MAIIGCNQNASGSDPACLLGFKTALIPQAVLLNDSVAHNPCIGKSLGESDISLILFYNLVIIYSQCALLWHIRGERETETETERQREFAFVYNICICTWSSVRTCVV